MCQPFLCLNCTLSCVLAVGVGGSVGVWCGWCVVGGWPGLVGRVFGMVCGRGALGYFMVRLVQSGKWYSITSCKSLACKSTGCCC